ncbi:MAG: hypothetical protein IT379_31595 [Deltaproteobacteria bacterium]|nr:hypothetical protein [Deltaproteobacteria bacterium]
MEEPAAAPIDEAIPPTPTPPDLVRVALHPETSRDDVDDAMCARGWLLVQIVTGTSEHPAQSIFLTKDRHSLLYYVEDAVIDAAYFVVRGPRLDDVAAEIRASVRCMSRSELLLNARSPDDATAARALFLLAITALGTDTEVVAVIDAARSHESETVRDAARLAYRTLVPQRDAEPSPSEAP